MPFAPIDKAVEAFGRGEIVVVVDDADRENEGDLIVAAEFATPEKIAFFLSHTSGVICMPMLGERLDQLELPPMVAENTDPRRTAFTVYVAVAADIRDRASGPLIGVSEASLIFTSVPGGLPLSRQVQVRNIGGGSLTDLAAAVTYEPGPELAAWEICA